MWRTECVLFGDLRHSWKVIVALKGLELRYALDAHARIVPDQITIRFDDEQTILIAAMKQMFSNLELRNKKRTSRSCRLALFGSPWPQ